jgi:hypothetical protein
MELSKDFAASSGNNHEIPHSGESDSRHPVFISEDGIDMQSRKVSNKLRAGAAQNPGKETTSDQINFPHHCENKLRL